MSQDPRIGDVSMPSPPSRTRPTDVRAPSIAAPAEVAAAIQAHERVTARWQEANDARKAAEQAAKNAYKQDVIADADAIARGDEPAPPSKRSEPKAQAAAAEADRHVAAVSEAGRRTHDAVLDAIIAHRDQWLADVQALDDQAVAQFRDAVASLRDAATTLAETRGADRWLRHVNAERRELPMHVATSSLKAHDVGASGNGAGGRDHQLTDILDALDRVVDPPAEPAPLTGPLHGQPTRRFPTAA